MTNETLRNNLKEVLNSLKWGRILTLAERLRYEEELLHLERFITRQKNIARRKRSLT
jgi:hypothetical protein